MIQEIVAHANRAAGAAFTHCVLTVPVHASVRTREAVKSAAEQAGLKVRAIINEPTAAALYYANLRSPEQSVMIFDLGGGTLDVTLLSVKNKVVKVIAAGGDAFLGGGNFDEAIVSHYVDKFQQQHGINLRDNPVVMQRLVFAAENAKVQLSKQLSAVMRVPCIAQRPNGEFIHFEFTITRQEMDQICSRLIDRAASACDDVLEKAKMKPTDVDELVLVGGQTRMPAIRARLQGFKEIASDKDVNPELGVAIGAALLGRNIQRGMSGLADVVPMSINALMPGGRTVELIAPNSPVPCKRSVELEGMPTWSAPVPVMLFEALDSTSTDREMLGSVPIAAEWRVGSGGAPTLTVNMGIDFQLRAKLSAPNGKSADVEIVDLKPPAKSPPNAAKPSAPRVASTAAAFTARPSAPLAQPAARPSAPGGGARPMPPAASPARSGAPSAAPSIPPATRPMPPAAKPAAARPGAAPAPPKKK